MSMTSKAVVHARFKVISHAKSLVTFRKMIAHP